MNGSHHRGKLAKLAMAGRIAEGPARKIIQLGGAHRDIKGMPGYEAYHMPGNKVSFEHGQWAGDRDVEGRPSRASHIGKGKDADAFRQSQAAHITRGDFRAAMQMNIDLVRKKFGSKYDKAIDQMLKHSQ